MISWLQAVRSRIQAPDLDRESQVEAAGIAALRRALHDYDDPQPDGSPLTLAQAVHRLDRISAQILRLRYRDAATELPDLLEHLYVLADGTTGPAEQGRAALHDAYRLAASIAGQYRQTDLAAICSERHVSLAPLTGDPLRIPVSAFHRAGWHLQAGDFTLGLRILDRARQYLDTTPAGSAMAIQLHLRSAVLAARAGDRLRADDFAKEARQLDDRSTVDPRPYAGIDSSRLNINVHWCAIPVEDYDGTTAVSRAAQVRIIDSTRPERVGHHWADMARAWLLHGDRDRAIACLNRARRAAPNRIRNHPTVRNTVITLANTDRRATQSLANFARWANIDI